MQNYFWPPSGGGSSSNASVAPTGVTAPTSATEVGGVNQSTGFLQPLQLDPSNYLLVDVGTSALPSGAATAANQVTGNNSLSTIATNTTGVATSALQTTGNTSLSTIATNTTGVATAANQTTGNTSLSTIVSNTTTMNGSLGSATGGTAGTSSQLSGGIHSSSTPTLTGGQQAALQLDASGNLLTNVNSSALPTGAATSALQTTGNTSLSTIATNTTGVATAANQTTGNTSLATIATNTTGVSTAANQTTQTGYLTTIASPIVAVNSSPPTNLLTMGVKYGAGGNMTYLALGSNTMALSLPVTMATDQTPIQVRASTSGVTDGSNLTSATPSTSTQIFAANSTRKYLLIQNMSSSATIYINFTAAATVGEPSIALLPYGSFVMEGSFVSTEIINVISTTASVPFTAKQA